MEFEGNWGYFYQKCLTELKNRPDFTEAYLPMLERFVFMTKRAAEIGEEISDEDLTVKHTNRAEKTNDVSNPKWRIYLELNKQISALGKDLRLSPVNAPEQKEKKEKPKGFETGMKVSKTA